MRSRWWGALAVVAMCAAGCTGGSGSASSSPASTPTSSSLTSAPTSAPVSRSSTAPSTVVPTTGPNVQPGETPPVLPAVGLKNDPAGANAFATYWIEALSWAYATTSSVLARSLFVPTCAGCSHFLNVTIDAISAKHEHFRGGRIYVTETQLRPSDGHFGSTAIVDTTIAQQASKLVSDKGVVVQRSAALSGAVFRTWLRWQGTRWSVVDWKQAVQK